MRKVYIKKVVMAASLGLAIFFSVQALAVDLVFASCVFDSDTSDLILGIVHTSSGATLPKEVKEGESCPEAIKALKALDCGPLGFDLRTIDSFRSPGRGNQSDTNRISTGQQEIQFAVACPEP